MKEMNNILCTKGRGQALEFLKTMKQEKGEVLWLRRIRGDIKKKIMEKWLIKTEHFSPSPKKTVLLLKFIENMGNRIKKPQIKGANKNLQRVLSQDARKRYSKSTFYYQERNSSQWPQSISSEWTSPQKDK